MSRRREAEDKLEIDPVAQLVALDRLRQYAPSGSPDECWLWTGRGVNPQGYPQIPVGRHTNLAAARVALILDGRPPRNLHALHRCNTRACVNPAHLYVGTHRQNMADREAARRTSRGEKHSPKGMTEAKARAIYADAAAGMSDPGAAAKHGVSKRVVHQIRTGHTWKHLGLEPIRRRGKPFRATREQREKVRAMAKAGASYRETVEATGLSVESVRRLRRGAGVERGQWAERAGKRRPVARA